MSFLEKGTPWDTGKQRMDYGMTMPLKILLFVFGFIPWLAGVLLIIGRTLEVFRLL